MGFMEKIDAERAQGTVQRIYIEMIAQMPAVRKSSIAFRFRVLLSPIPPILILQLFQAI